MITKTFNADSSDWHLSGVQVANISNIFDYVLDEVSQIQPKEMEGVSKRAVDILYYLRMGGRELLLEPLRHLQPKSFAVLDQFASKYKMGFLWNSIIPAPHLPKTNFVSHGFFEVNGIVVFIGQPICPDKFFGGDDRAEVFPETIANSWLKHGAGWGIGMFPFGSTSFRQLIGNPYNWQSLEGILSSFLTPKDKPWQEVLLPIVQDKVPNVYVTHYNPHDGSPSEWCSMRCFLDTRPHDLAGKCGDQFFVIDSSTDKVIYHIHDGDVENLRILRPETVGEVMDEYCAHTLLRTEGRFDFLPWSVQL